MTFRRAFFSVIPRNGVRGVRFFRAKLACVDAKLVDPVLDDSFGRPKELRRTGLIAAGLLKGPQDQCPFLGLDNGIEFPVLLPFVGAGEALEGGR